MKIAVVSSHIVGETDQIISEVAARLMADGKRLSGIIKVLDSNVEGDHHCDMDVLVLPDGPKIRITQTLGGGSEGCRLNPTALVEAVAEVEQDDMTNVDLFILNKFGPQEAEGRGFCDAIAAALASETPVLVGVGAAREAFDAFVDGMAESMPADQDAIYAWCKAAAKNP